MSMLSEDGEAEDGSGWWKYYIWLGAVRFELSRRLTRWERIRCWFSPWYYEEEFIMPPDPKTKEDENE